MATASGPAYPVTFSVQPTERFRRVNLLLRLGVFFILGWLSEFGLSVLYLLAPIVSAILIAQRGGAEFHSRHGETYRRALRFYVGLTAYLRCATDDFPSWNEERAVRLDVNYMGTPTVGSALLRLITVIPHLIILALMGAVSFVLILVAYVTVLVDESVPDWVVRFQSGVSAWEARALGYYVSLVDEYPPFRFESAIR